ncbi:reverse transcriptase domain-containing protein [Tanacetum coccineum]
MSSPNHSTSDIEDAFSSMNILNYTSVSPDYFPASSGVVLLLFDNFDNIIPTVFSSFYNNTYLKDVQTFYAKESPISSPDPITPPTILTPSPVLPPSLLFDLVFLVPEETITTLGQIEDILNYLDELYLHHIEKIEEGIIDRMIIRRNNDKLKTELKKIRTQIIKLQKKRLGQKDKIAFAYYRISNLEQIIEKIQLVTKTDRRLFRMMAPKRTSTSKTPAITLDAIRHLKTGNYKSLSVFNLSALMVQKEHVGLFAVRPNRINYSLEAVVLKENKEHFATGTLTDDALSWLTISPNVEVSFFKLLRTTDDVEDMTFDVYALPCSGLVLFVQRISLIGFPAQSIGSSNTDVLDSPCLLVLITRTSQSRQHVISHIDVLGTRNAGLDCTRWLWLPSASPILWFFFNSGRPLKLLAVFLILELVDSYHADNDTYSLMVLTLSRFRLNSGASIHVACTISGLLAVWYMSAPGPFYDFFRLVVRSYTQVSIRCFVALELPMLSLESQGGPWLHADVLWFVFSLFGMKRGLHVGIFGWILVIGTFVLCGVFLVLHNVTADTCVSMNQWVENPTSHTALDDILPCVDNATALETSMRSREVTSQLVNVINQVYEETKGRAKDAVISLINQESEGKHIDRALLNNVLGIYVKLGWDKSSTMKETLKLLCLLILLITMLKKHQLD